MRLVQMAGCVLAAALLFIISAPPTHAAEVMRFLTNIAPPYQVMVGGTLDGTSTRAFNCVMDRMNHRYEVGLAPWLRAREQVRQGLADGVFSVASDIGTGEQIGGKFSLPLALERWVWVRSVGQGAVPAQMRQGLPVAAVLGSNQLKWLQVQDANVDGAARSGTQLLRMLAGGRVSAVLMDEAELHAAWQEAGVSPTMLEVTFQRYMPLGVYFSDAFLDANPGFLAKFNEQVPHCAAANMALTPQERRKALTVAQQVRDAVLAEPSLQSALHASWRVNGGKTVQQIIAEDRTYQVKRGKSNDPMVLALRDHPLTGTLARLRRMTLAVVSEVLLFDAVGMAVASDPLSTDLWQADERKYSMTVPQGSDTIFIDDIAFDQSTSQFSVQVTFAIADEQSGSVIGGLTVGLNIERTLNGS